MCIYIYIWRNIWIFLFVAIQHLFLRSNVEIRKIIKNEEEDEKEDKEEEEKEGALVTTPL